MPCGQHQRFRALNQQSSTYAILETLTISGTYLNERVTYVRHLHVTTPRGARIKKARRGIPGGLRGRA